jgi:RNA polymerase sigma factor (sigma-70 family)
LGSSVLTERVARLLVRLAEVSTLPFQKHVPTPPYEDTIDQLGAMARDERRTLVSVARGEGLTAEEALECVQDALCTFLTTSKTNEHALSSVKTMVRNAARNFRRRHRRIKPHEAIDAGHEPAASSIGAEDLVAQAEQMLRLRACVAELCTIQRAVVTLRLLEERSGEDVAETLGLARGHVDVLVHRAKAALRTCMDSAL